jgi:hypothetical protein
MGALTGNRIATGIEKVNLQELRHGRLSDRDERILFSSITADGDARRRAAARNRLRSLAVLIRRRKRSHAAQYAADPGSPCRKANDSADAASSFCSSARSNADMPTGPPQQGLALASRSPVRPVTVEGMPSVHIAELFNAATAHFVAIRA